MSTFMGSMIFQASRRQLLVNLIDYFNQYEAGETPAVSSFQAPPSVPNLSTLPELSTPIPELSTSLPDSLTSSFASSLPDSPTSSQRALENADIADDTKVDTKEDTKDTKEDVAKENKPSIDSPTWRRRKIEMLKAACKAADEEVTKMEYWSDIKDITRKGETLTAEEMGTSGARMGNDKRFAEVRVSQMDMKGKGKAVMR